jgi:maltose alpha-D-glucosyltransferase/alpha-amylase
MGAKPMERNNKVQLAYHFPENAAIWAALIEQKSDVFWKIMNRTPKLPKSGTWSGFLRVHDEISVELFPGAKLKQKIYNALAPKGEPFREGYAVGGRLASFLDEDPKRINLSNAILFSLPGVPLIYYGDEIGELNSPTFMKQAAEARKEQAAKSGASVKDAKDGRDMGRGPIPKDRLFDAMNHPETHGGQIFQHTKNLIAIRKQEEALVKGTLSRISASEKHIFSYLREHGYQRILVANNLSDKDASVQLKLPGRLPVKELPANGLEELQSRQTLPYQINAWKNSIQISLKPYESVWIKLPETNHPTIGNLFGLLT